MPLSELRDNWGPLARQQAVTVWELRATLHCLVSAGLLHDCSADQWRKRTV